MTESDETYAKATSRHSHYGHNHLELGVKWQIDANTLTLKLQKVGSIWNR